MTDAGYAVITTADVAVTTAKSILGVKSHANFGLSLTEVRVSCDGVTASAVPGLIELCYCTFATNSPGTNSTSRTPIQEYGRVIAVGATAASAWSSEPTTVSPIDEQRLTPNGGLVIWRYPLGTEPDCAVSEGFVIRATFGASVNLRATMKFRRC